MTFFEQQNLFSAVFQKHTWAIQAWVLTYDFLVTIYESLKTWSFKPFSLLLG